MDKSVRSTGQTSAIGRAVVYIVLLLGAKHRNVMVVGDSDQCLVPGTLVATPQGPRPIETIAVGDVVMSTAAIAALRRRFPAATLTYVTGRWSLPAIEHNPHLDHIVLWAGARSSLPGRLQDQAALLRLLKSRQSSLLFWLRLATRRSK